MRKRLSALLVVPALAMLAFEATRFLPQWDVRVLGTDISPTVIDAARRAVYPKARLDTMPANYLRTYFDDQAARIQEVVSHPAATGIALGAGPLGEEFDQQLANQADRDRQAKEELRDQVDQVRGCPGRVGRDRRRVDHQVLREQLAARGMLDSRTLRESRHGLIDEERREKAGGELPGKGRDNSGGEPRRARRRP